MENYEVGQILYMTSKKSFKIIPVQVVEEVIRTTIKGKEKTYMICFPNEEKTIVDIKTVKTRLFKNTSETEKYLIENTRQAIKVLVEEANTIKDEVFGKSPVVSHDIEPVDEIMQQDNSDGIIRVDLGNGLFGRLKQDPISDPEKK